MEDESISSKTSEQSSSTEHEDLKAETILYKRLLELCRRTREFDPEVEWDEAEKQKRDTEAFLAECPRRVFYRREKDTGYYPLHHAAYFGKHRALIC